MNRPRVIASKWARLKAKGIATFCLAALVVFGATVCQGQTATNTDGWVVLPVDEYRTLRRAAFPMDPEPEPPPVEATLTRIDYDLRVEGEMASGEARLTIDVLKDGWARVAIPTGLMIREARLDGRSISLVGGGSEKGTGSTQLLLSHTGRSVLTLTIVTPVSAVAGTAILRLPASPSAVSRAVVTLPSQPDRGVDVRATGGLLLERSDTAGGSRWVANGRGNEPLVFAWRRKVDDQKATQALRMRGEFTQLVGLGEDGAQVTAEVRIEVLQGVAKDVRVLLPDQFAVGQVAGAMIADWDATPQGLVVSFLEPVQQTTRFTVRGELRLPRDGKIDIPLIRLPGAERESGGVAVEVLGAGEIKDQQSSGMDEAEAADLGPMISSRQSPSLVAFRLRPAEGKSTRSLSLQIARYSPQAVLAANVEEAAYNVLVTEEGKMLVSARLAVRNNQRNFLRFTLPANAVLWSVAVAGRPIRPGKAADGTLLVPLEKTRTGDEAPAFAVDIAYLDHVPVWSEKGRARVSLLAIDMPISRSSVVLHFPPQFRLNPVPGSFRAATYTPPVSSAFRTSGGGPVDNEKQQVSDKDAKEDATKQAVQRLQMAGRVSRPGRNLPIRVAFPHFGPSVFLVAELTSENQTPTIELDFQREKKRGER